jgi:DNA-binding MarR family transcriptional regulator
VARGGVRFGKIEETVPLETIRRHLGSGPIDALVSLRRERRASAGFLYGDKARPRPLAKIAEAFGFERSTFARHLRELSAMGYAKAHGHGAAGCRIELLDPPPRSKEEIEGLCASLAHERKARRQARRPRAERLAIEAHDQDGADVVAGAIGGPGVVARAGQIAARSRRAGSPETEPRRDDSMSAGATTRPPAYTDARAENLYPKNQNPETKPTTNPRAELETGAGERSAGRAGGGGLLPAAGNLGGGIGRVMAQAAAARKATAGKEGAGGPDQAQTIGQGGANPTKPHEIRHPGDAFDRGPNATGRNETQHPKSPNPQGDTPANPLDFAAGAGLRAQLDGLEDRAHAIAERRDRAFRAWSREHPEPARTGAAPTPTPAMHSAINALNLPGGYFMARALADVLAFTNFSPEHVRGQAEAVAAALPQSEFDPTELVHHVFGVICQAAGVDPAPILRLRDDHNRRVAEAEAKRGAWAQERADALAAIRAADASEFEAIEAERAGLRAQLEAIGRERERVRAEAAAVEAARREREAAERAVAAIPGLAQARDAELRAGKFSPDVVAQAALEAAVSIAGKAAKGEPVLNVRGYLNGTCVRLKAEGLPVVGAVVPGIVPGSFKRAADLTYLEQYERRRPQHRRSAADADYFEQFEWSNAGSAH